MTIIPYILCISYLHSEPAGENMGVGSIRLEYRVLKRVWKGGCHTWMKSLGTSTMSVC